MIQMIKSDFQELKGFLNFMKGLFFIYNEFINLQNLGIKPYFLKTRYVRAVKVRSMGHKYLQRLYVCLVLKV